jgi:hypothetical protein
MVSNDTPEREPKGRGPDNRPPNPNENPSSYLPARVQIDYRLKVIKPIPKGFYLTF